MKSVLVMSILSSGLLFCCRCSNTNDSSTSSIDSTISKHNLLSQENKIILSKYDSLGLYKVYFDTVKQCLFYQYNDQPLQNIGRFVNSSGEPPLIHITSLGDSIGIGITLITNFLSNNINFDEFTLFVTDTNFSVQKCLTVTNLGKYNIEEKVPDNAEFYKYFIIKNEHYSIIKLEEYFPFKTSHASPNNTISTFYDWDKSTRCYIKRK